MDNKNKLLKIQTDNLPEKTEEDWLKIILGQTRNDPNKYVYATPEALFQHNCLVLGSIGTGKSWTMSRLIYETLRFNSKIITIDQMAEFSNITKDTLNVYFGTNNAMQKTAKPVSIQSTLLNISEILHLLKLNNGKEKTLFLEITHKVFQARKESSNTDSTNAKIDINQVISILDQLLKNNLKQNLIAENLRNIIISRIYSEEFLVFFDNKANNSISDILKVFFNSKIKHLNIQLKSVSNKNGLKDIIINCLCRQIEYFHSLQDKDQKPLVIFVDNAENFVNDETELKEFYSLIESATNSNIKICFSLKSPCSLSEDFLSKIGCIISHRLKSEKDIEMLRQSSSLIDSQNEALIPYFQSGEAIFLNASQFKPFLVKIAHPVIKPLSNSNTFQNSWG